METFLTVITLASLVVLIVLALEACKISNDFSKILKIVFTALIFGISLLVLNIYNKESKQPKALDVYRDKAELKLIYTINNYGDIYDTSKIDSIVIWKHKEITIE